MYRIALKKKSGQIQENVQTISYVLIVAVLMIALQLNPRIVLKLLEQKLHNEIDLQNNNPPSYNGYYFTTQLCILFTLYIMGLIVLKSSSSLNLTSYIFERVILRASTIQRQKSGEAISLLPVKKLHNCYNSRAKVLICRPVGTLHRDYYTYYSLVI